MSFAIDRLSNQQLIDRGLAKMVRQQIAAENKPPPQPQYAFETPGVIYAVQALPVEAVKFGFSRGISLEYRVKALQTGNPYPIKVLARADGLPDQERAIHRLLAVHRLTGEWFAWGPEVAALIEDMKRGALPPSQHAARL